MKNKSLVAGLMSLGLIGLMTVACGKDPAPGEVNQGNQQEGPPPVRIIEPASETVYTNDTVVFELEVDEDEELYDVEIVIAESEESDEESIAELEDSLTFTWSTLDRTPGTYRIQIKYGFEGEVHFLEEERTIIVDRRAPEIVSVTPETGVHATAPTSPITVTFDEVLLAATVSAANVSLTNLGEEVTHTAALSADGLTITVEFDNSDITLPADVVLTFDGVTDLAGNGVEEAPSWQTLAWLEEEFREPNLTHFRIVEVNDQEYLIAVHATHDEGNEARIKIFQSEDGSWEHVLTSETFLTIHAMDAAVLGDEIYIAYMVTSAQLRRTRLLVFDSVENTLEATSDSWVPNGDDTGQAALSLSMTSDMGLLAGVSRGKLFVNEFTDQNLMGNGTPTFDIDEYDFVRAETIRTNIRSDGRREVIFSHCTKEAPCSSTHTRHLTKAASAEEWTVSPGSFSYDSNTSECDKFNGFDAGFSADGPLAVMSYRNQCPGVPFASGGRGTGLGVGFFPHTGIASLIPGDDTASVYRPYIVATGATRADVLFVAPGRLEFLAASQGSLEWVNSVETGLTIGESQDTQYRGAGLFRTSHGLIVAVSYGGDVYIFRANE